MVGSRILSPRPEVPTSTPRLRSVPGHAASWAPSAALPGDPAVSTGHFQNTLEKTGSEAPEALPLSAAKFPQQHSQLPKRPLHPYYTDVPHLTVSNSIIRNIFSAIHLPDCLPPAPSVPSLPSRFSGRAQCWSDPLGRLLSTGCLLTPCSPRIARIDADFKANQPSCFYVSGL